jgi:hypothetical protein
MALPSPRTGVPRGDVHKAIRAMLLNPDVGDVECTEEEDGTYNVVPHPRNGDAG